MPSITPLNLNAEALDGYSVVERKVRIHTNNQIVTLHPGTFLLYDSSIQPVIQIDGGSVLTYGTDYSINETDYSAKSEYLLYGGGSSGVVFVKSITITGATNGDTILLTYNTLWRTNGMLNRYLASVVDSYCRLLDVDTTGLAADNLIEDEEHEVNVPSGQRIIAPAFGSFHKDSMEVEKQVDGVWSTVDSSDYEIHGIDVGRTKIAASDGGVYRYILYTGSFVGRVRLSYQAFGGETRSGIMEYLAGCIQGILDYLDYGISYEEHTHTGYQLTSQKGSPDGYPDLDSSGKVPEAQLPADIGGGLKWQGDLALSTGQTTLPSVTPIEEGYWRIVGGESTGYVDPGSNRINLRQGDLLAYANSSWFSIPVDIYANDYKIADALLRFTSAIGSASTVEELANAKQIYDYVQSHITVSGIGPYDADANDPVLNPPTAGEVNVGDMFLVTKSGTAWYNVGDAQGDDLFKGDLLIAETSDPAALSDWNVIRDFIDITTATFTSEGTVKIGDTTDDPAMKSDADDVVPTEQNVRNFYRNMAASGGALAHSQKGISGGVSPLDMGDFPIVSTNRPSKPNQAVAKKWLDEQLSVLSAPGSVATIERRIDIDDPPANMVLRDGIAAIVDSNSEKTLLAIRSRSTGVFEILPDGTNPAGSGHQANGTNNGTLDITTENLDPNRIARIARSSEISNTTTRGNVDVIGVPPNTRFGEYTQDYNKQLFLNTSDGSPAPLPIAVRGSTVAHFDKNGFYGEYPSNCGICIANMDTPYSGGRNLSVTTSGSDTGMKDGVVLDDGNVFLYPLTGKPAIFDPVYNTVTMLNDLDVPISDATPLDTRYTKPCLLGDGSVLTFIGVVDGTDTKIHAVKITGLSHFETVGPNPDRTWTEVDTGLIGTVPKRAIPLDNGTVLMVPGEDSDSATEDCCLKIYEPNTGNVRVLSNDGTHIREFSADTMAVHLPGDRVLISVTDSANGLDGGLYVYDPTMTSPDGLGDVFRLAYPSLSGTWDITRIHVDERIRHNKVYVVVEVHYLSPDLYGYALFTVDAVKTETDGHGYLSGSFLPEEERYHSISITENGEVFFFDEPDTSAHTTSVMSVFDLFTGKQIDDESSVSVDINTISWIPISGNRLLAVPIYDTNSGYVNCPVLGIDRDSGEVQVHQGGQNLPFDYIIPIAKNADDRAIRMKLSEDEQRLVVAWRRDVSGSKYLHFESYSRSADGITWYDNEVPTSVPNYPTTEGLDIVIKDNCKEAVALYPDYARLRYIHDIDMYGGAHRFLGSDADNEDDSEPHGLAICGSSVVTVHKRSDDTIKIKSWATGLEGSQATVSVINDDLSDGAIPVIAGDENGEFLIGGTKVGTDDNRLLYGRMGSPSLQEIRTLLEDFNPTPNFVAGNTHTFESVGDGSWTVPANVQTIRCIVTGPGRDINAVSGYHKSGGAGATSIKTIVVSGGDVVSYHVGVATLGKDNLADADHSSLSINGVNMEAEGAPPNGGVGELAAVASGGDLNILGGVGNIHVGSTWEKESLGGISYWGSSPAWGSGGSGHNNDIWVAAASGVVVIEELIKLDNSVTAPEVTDWFRTIYNIGDTNDEYITLQAEDGYTQELTLTGPLSAIMIPNLNSTYPWVEVLIDNSSGQDLDSLGASWTVVYGQIPRVACVLRVLFGIKSDGTKYARILDTSPNSLEEGTPNVTTTWRTANADTSLVAIGTYVFDTDLDLMFYLNSSGDWVEV